MEEINWSTFTLRIPIRAGIQQIYHAWTTSAALESWFLRKAEFTTAQGTPRNSDEAIQAGDQYAWYWHGYTDAVVEHGKILETNGKDKLKFEFGKAGIVTLNVITIDGETVAEIIQEEIPLDEQAKKNYHVGCSVGWTFYLANLKSILEGGLDLRNKNENISLVVSS